jgi:arginase
VNVRILTVPYDSGVRRVRMGLGPERLLARGLPATLANRGHEPAVETIEIPEASPPLEVGNAFRLNRLLAERVRAAVAAGSFPVVLAGNCNTAAGTLAGIGPERTGVLWLDSHGDLNSPETTGSGFFDGMALAMVTGRCWSTLAAGIPGFLPVPDRQVVLAGARDLDAAEEALLAASEIGVVSAHSLRGGSETFERTFSALAARVRRLYVHIDLDVLDRDEARANQFAAPGGPTTSELSEVLRAVGARVPVAAVAVTAYDPTFDPEGDAADAALALVGTVLETVRG